MKRYELYIKDLKDDAPLATLGVIHQDEQQIILTYYNSRDPQSFAQDIQKRCQQLQSYDLKEDPNSSRSEDLSNYLVLGINDIACMIYLIQKGDQTWLDKYKSDLLSPKSFYLNWDKQGGFKAEWV